MKMLTTCKSTCDTRIRIHDGKSEIPLVKEYFQTAEVLEYASEIYNQADLLNFLKNQLRWVQKLASDNAWIVIFNVDFNLCGDHFTFSMTCGKVDSENQIYYFPYCLCNSQVNAQDLINTFELF